jgi:RimJ/RimL family protein N-acetyltransferase
MLDVNSFAPGKVTYNSFNISFDIPFAVGIYALNHDVDRDVWTLSYVNRYDDWGKGYTVEGMNALMMHAAKIYGARTFEGECAKENIGSRRVMEKLGMVYDHSSSYTKNDGSVTFESDVFLLTIQKEKG